MSESAEMVQRAWDDIRYPKRWVQTPSRRTWTDRYGNEVSDLMLAKAGVAGNPRYYENQATQQELDHMLSMIQLSNTNIVTRREAMEKVAFT